MKNPAPAWLRQLNNFERAATFAAFTFMVVAIFADVLWRETTGVGLHWARQAGVYANIFVVMLGLGLASSAGTHLRPKFADGWLPDSWDRQINRLAEFLTAVFFSAFAYFGAKITYSALMLEERSVLIGVLVWPMMAVIPLAFLIATVRHAAFAVNPDWRPADEIRVDS